MGRHYPLHITTTPDDPSLVAAAQAGDRASLEVLLRNHHDRVFAICRRLTGNDADAADATQEALIALVRGLSRYDGRAAFSTWAYRVVTNACLDEMRRRKRRPDPGLPEQEIEQRGAAPSLDEATADRLTIDDALQRIPEEFRSAVVLRDITGMDYAEIAEVLGIPPGTVRSRIARGRAQLANHLTEQGRVTRRLSGGNQSTSVNVQGTT